MTQTSRTQRAGLTAVSRLFQTAVGMATGLLVTPFIIRGLGLELYGGWLFVIGVVGYVSLVDFAPNSVLKLILATQQHSDDKELKQREVGAAFLTPLLSFPIYLVSAGVLYWALPRLIKLDVIYMDQVRLVAVLLVLSAGLTNFTSVPGFVLRGVNLDYKATPIRTVLGFLTAIMDVIVVWLGWGLVGLGANRIFGVLLQAGVLAFVTRRNVPWFGVRWPRRAEVVTMLRMGAWNVLSRWGGAFSGSMETSLIGYILGPVSLAVYSLTGRLLTALSGPISRVLLSGTPGLGDLFGRRQFERLREVRLQLELATLAIYGVIASVILVGNQWFITLWVGEEKFAGQAVNIWLTVTTMLFMLTYIQHTMLLTCFSFKDTVRLQLVAAGLGFLASVMLTYRLGLVGIPLGNLCGRLVAVLGYTTQLGRVLDQPPRDYGAQLFRLASVVMVILMVSAGAGALIVANSWPLLFGAGGLTGLLASGIIWGIGFTPAQRRQFAARAVVIHELVKLRFASGSASYSTKEII